MILGIRQTMALAGYGNPGNNQGCYIQGNSPNQVRLRQYRSGVYCCPGDYGKKFDPYVY